MEKNEEGVRKGTWTKEEDILLRNCIEKYGEGKWHQVPLRAGLNRCRKSCRLRWMNYLRPNIKRGYFTKDEVDLIVRLHKLLGNRWSLIAGRLPGRTANDVKNFWNTHISKNSLANGDNNPTICKQKMMIKESNIIKPRPRTLTISKLQQPPNCIEMTETNIIDEDLKKKEQYSSSLKLSDDVNRDDKWPSSSVPLSREENINVWTNNSDENHQKGNEGFSTISREEVDGCIQWWSSLLEITENGEGLTPFSFSDEDDLCGLANNYGNLDRLMTSSSVDVDVWDLSMELCFN